MIHRYLAFLLLLGLLVAMGTPAAAQPGPERDSLKGKKLIEWGWDEPDTKFIRANVEKMERFPFDGCECRSRSAAP